MRDTIFISHANPEDNEFAQWLYLRLVRSDYKVWVDMHQLIGGEFFWENIENIIRQETIKFLFILSSSSVRKDGPNNEISVAAGVARDDNLKDFIIPLHLDDYPHSKMPIQIHRINAIQFEKGWAHGLRKLLKKFEKDNIPKNPDSGPQIVTKLWKTYHDSNNGIKSIPEEYLTNWFQIKSLSDLFLHELGRTGIGKIEVNLETLPFPAFQHGSHLVTFADAEDFEESLGFGIKIEKSDTFSIINLLNGKENLPIERREAQNWIKRLFRMSWEKMLKDRKLPTHELSNNKTCFYFTEGLAENNYVSLTEYTFSCKRKKLIGYQTKQSLEGKKYKRYWHFGISTFPILYPTYAFCVRPHVLFSDNKDGKLSSIWENYKRMQKARRSQCKFWWNDDWRDRILATMKWLANGKDAIELPVSTERKIRILSLPVVLDSSVSFDDPVKLVHDVSTDVDKEEYEDDE